MKKGLSRQCSVNFRPPIYKIDKDFSAKLSGYGCVGHLPDTEVSKNSVAVANLSVETLERGLLTPKSNVWSFGAILLELLTVRRNLDGRHSKEERNLVKWSRPFLADDCRLSLIMDPQLKGRFPAKAARTMADIALRCLQKDPSKRPTMRSVVEHLRIIQDMKHSCRLPLQETASMGSCARVPDPASHLHCLLDLGCPSRPVGNYIAVSDHLSSFYAPSSSTLEAVIEGF